MRRLTLLSLALLLASCTDPHRGLTPDAAVAEAREAAAQGDARQALSLLRSASRREHLGAIATLASAYETGYLQAEAGAHAAPVTVPIRTWPWDGERWRRMYDFEARRIGSAEGPEGPYVRVSRPTSL